MKKIYVITGASDGIGAELARQLAGMHGASAGIVLAARGADKLEQVAKDIRGLGVEALVVPTDVTDRVACKNLIAKTIEAFGRLDVIVQNAGMSAHANFEDVTDEDLDWYQDLMTLNFWSTVWLSKDALPHLLKSKGQIVAVSSVAGLFGVPGRTAYSSSKWAMGGFYDALRAEVARKGVAVTMVHPGIVATEIRARGFTNGGGPLGESSVREDKMMPLDVCVRKLIAGMEARKREVLFTFQMRIGRWLRLLVPGLVDKLSMREIKPEYHPD